ncbi:unnamed protein product [Paramecium sonneborni]|uniref:Uncharacterized protein n=1 Tax=Paramecium sonneborni TaxID=65129 RepID=A0A8S1QQ15_9CILI|nr:unnamed protein product [Paramecium sonneborni]
MLYHINKNGQNYLDNLVIIYNFQYLHLNLHKFINQSILIQQQYHKYKKISKLLYNFKSIIQKQMMNSNNIFNYCNYQIDFIHKNNYFKNFKCKYLNNFQMHCCIHIFNFNYNRFSLLIHTCNQRKQNQNNYQYKHHLTNQGLYNNYLNYIMILLKYHRNNYFNIFIIESQQDLLEDPQIQSDITPPEHAYLQVPDKALISPQKVVEFHINNLLKMLNYNHQYKSHFNIIKLNHNKIYQKIHKYNLIQFHQYMLIYKFLIKHQYQHKKWLKYNFILLQLHMNNLLKMLNYNHQYKHHFNIIKSNHNKIYQKIHKYNQILLHLNMLIYKFLKMLQYQHKKLYFSTLNYHFHIHNFLNLNWSCILLCMFQFLH